MTRSHPIVRTVRVHKNRYGNYVCFAGPNVVDKTDGWNAKLWLARQVLAGLKVSASSYFSEKDIEKYKALV